MPAVLGDGEDSLASIERKSASAFFSSGMHAQRRFEFKAYRHRDVLSALQAIFHGKCAYCESRLSAVAPLDVEHFRPKGPVVEAEDHPGYWWLANSWDNLLLACPDCNRRRMHASSISGKGNRFPLVDEKARAYRPGEEAHESPLLLDPTRDDPEKFLVFDTDGLVLSKHPRGQATIELLGLNRKHLVEARSISAQRLKIQFDRVEILMNQSGLPQQDLKRHLADVVGQIGQHASPTHEYAAMHRQAIAAFLRTRHGEQFKDAGWVAPDRSVSDRAIAEAKVSHRRFQKQGAQYSLKNESGREVYRSQRRLIEHIDITNIKSIRHVAISIGESGDAGTPWLMLLGENGVGKSSVLQAVAIAIMGPEYFADLISRHGISPSDFLRYRCKKARIAVKLTSFERPHTVVFDGETVTFLSPTGRRSTLKVGKNGPVVDGDEWDGQAMLLAYGATRLLPRRAASKGKKQFVRVANLFDPFVPLADANAVLLAATPGNFGAMALALKDLLALPDEAEFTCVDKDVVVKLHGSKIPLRHLSDGYQSVVALVMDILEVGQRLWKTLSNAEGIVLLDEIETHLHPTWKMRIVSSLRRALPGVQFIATTHDPLCLRGLGKGEVAVLKRNPQREVKVFSDLPSPGDFRIDQLLTSEFFGLNTTTDPEVEREFDRYYALLANSRKNAAERKEFDELAASLEGRRYFGTTLREQLMYHAVDQLIVDGTMTQQLPRTELNRAAVQQISQLWSTKMAAKTES
jgi:uncharacterized protein (TIGR02646 family)